MQYVQIIAVLAVLQYLLFTAMVGRARTKYEIKAPATAGHEQFERALRVQENTLEQLVAFLPVLWIASMHWPDLWVAAIGLIWIIGRFIYRRLYLTDPAKRAPGFALTMVPTIVLLLMALVGAMAR